MQEENHAHKTIGSINFQANTVQQIKNLILNYYNSNGITNTVQYKVGLNAMSKFDFMKKIMGIMETQINNYFINNYRVNDASSYKYDGENILLPEITKWPFDGMCIETIYDDIIMREYLDESP